MLGPEHKGTETEFRSAYVDPSEGSIIEIIVVNLELLLTMPFADVSGETVQEFLEARIPEGRHVEYKSQLVNDLLNDIAAMVNTYGGVVFIGVAEERRLPLSVRGVEEATYEKLVNMCIDKFEPPFVPEAKTVDVEGRPVVIVRIDPDSVNRPLIIDGTVYVRQDHRNARADRERIRQLFSEVGPAQATAEALAPMSPSRFWSPSDPKARVMLVGAAIGCDIRLEPSSNRIVIGSEFRNWLLQQLGKSRLSEWFRAYALHVTGSDVGESWVTRGHNTSRNVNLWWNAGDRGAFREPAGGRCLLTLPGGYGAPPGATLALHVGIPLVADAGPQHPVTLEGLYRLMEALTVTLAADTGPAVLDQLLREQRGPIVGPTVFVGNAHSSIFELVDASAFNRVDDPPGPAYVEFVPEEGTDMKDGATRDEQLMKWMTEMLLDGGFLDFEQELHKRI